MNMNTCIKCGMPATIKVPDNRRGGRNACYCEHCYNEMKSYFFENGAKVGENATANRNHSYSIELETMRPTGKALLELHENKFERTADCTVDAEYKSPIYCNLRSPVRVSNMVIQRLINENEIVIDSHCGTHFHVGYANNSLGVQRIGESDSRINMTRRFYNSLFAPVSAWLESNQEKSVALFGRDFGTWARPVNMNSDALTHENFINVQHDNTIEFRQCFFRNSAQYNACMHTCDKIFSALEVHFWDKFSAAKNAAERKALAAKTARYIIRIIDKAASALV